MPGQAAPRPAPPYQALLLIDDRPLEKRLKAIKPAFIVGVHRSEPVGNYGQPFVRLALCRRHLFEVGTIEVCNRAPHSFVGLALMPVCNNYVLARGCDSRRTVGEDIFNFTMMFIAVFLVGLRDG